MKIKKNFLGVGKVIQFVPMVLSNIKAIATKIIFHTI